MINWIKDVCPAPANKEQPSGVYVSDLCFVDLLYGGRHVPGLAYFVIARGYCFWIGSAGGQMYSDGITGVKLPEECDGTVVAWAPLDWQPSDAKEG